MSTQGSQSSVTAVHVLQGGGGGRVSRWLAGGDHVLGRLRSAVGPETVIVVGVGDEPPRSVSAAAVEAADAELSVARLRRDGRDLEHRGVPGLVTTRRQLVRLCRARGRASLGALRDEPELLPRLQAGGWFIAGWRARSARRVALAARVPPVVLPPGLAADVAFWAGVREAATAREWARLTRSSYVVLCYHRLDGRALPGQERMDVAPRALRRQLRLLRAAGWRALSPEELVAFHGDPGATLPRRRFVLTVDDGFAEAVQELRRHGRHRPQMFVVTDSVGATAEWFHGVPLADWDELRELAEDGGVLGSHCRSHRRLQELPLQEVQAELVGSLAGLREAATVSVPLVAYPHGGHDAGVRDAARDAGYALAYTTQQGRNGAGTDPWCLRRVEPKAWDTAGSFWWKVLTAQSPPPQWERRLLRSWERRRDR